MKTFLIPMRLYKQILLQRKISLCFTFEIFCLFLQHFICVFSICMLATGAAKGQVGVNQPMFCEFSFQSIFLFWVFNFSIWLFLILFATAVDTPIISSYSLLSSPFSASFVVLLYWLLLLALKFPLHLLASWLGWPTVLCWYKNVVSIKYIHTLKEIFSCYKSAQNFYAR